MAQTQSANRLNSLLWDIARTYAEMDKVLLEIKQELDEEDKEAEQHIERWDFADQ